MAELTAEQRANLKDSSFADPDNNGLPIENPEHLRAAMARFGQYTGWKDEAAKKAGARRIIKRAKSFGVDSSGFEKTWASLLKTRTDRATLAAPVRLASGIEFEGVAARVHRPGDGLFYPEFGNRTEYRDAAELKRLAEQLPGKPVVVYHPGTPDNKVGPGTRVVGRIVSSRIEGDNAIARFRVDTDEARGAMAVGLTQLSLGYDVSHLDVQNYQRGTEVDHMAIVPEARCGGACSIRTDACTCSPACGVPNTNLLSKDHTMADANATPNQDEALRSLEAQRADAESRATAAQTLVASEKSRADQAAGTIIELQNQLSELRAQIAAGATAAETEAIQRESARADAAEAQVRNFDASFENRVRERVALVNKAAVVMGPEFRADSLSDREVMASVVKKLDPNADISQAVSTDMLRGRFETSYERHASTARSMARITETAAQTNRVDARAAAEDKRRNAWKQPLPSTALKNA